MLMNETYIILQWVKMITMSLILLPFVSYCFRIAWKEKNKSYIQKRRPIIAVFTVALLIVISFLWIFVDRRTCIFEYCTNISPSTEILIQYIPIGPFLLTILLRIWFLYYDLKYAEAIMSHQWWQILSSNDKDWFIENRNKYGVLSPTMFVITGIITLIYVIFILMGAYIDKKFQELFLSPFCLLLWIIMAILFCKMPRHYDVFAIRKEINRWTIWYFICGTYFILCDAAGLEEAYPTFVQLHGFVYIIETAGFALFATIYPYYRMNTGNKISQKANDSNIETSITRSKPSLSTTASRSNSKSTSSSSDNTWYSWINACGDDTNFNTFMRQLIKEFAVENLCFILEAMQFKQQFIPNLNTLVKDKLQLDDPSVGWIIKLPHCLPTSSIIQKEDNFEQQIISLYNKYVSNDADLCINISYAARKKFISDMNDIIAEKQEMNQNKGNQDEKESELTETQQKKATDDNDEHVETRPKMKIVKIFDKALKDINANLSSSFIRFQLYGNFDATPQDIIDVMMEQTR